MLVVQDAYESSARSRGAVVAIGNFDGVHRGQCAILERVVARARELRVAAAVVTFDPHPLAVLRPEHAPLAINTPAQKQRLLSEAGIAVLLVVRFTREFSRTPARQFVREVLWGRLRAREIHVGDSFSFGYRREGTFEVLRGLGEELGFSACGAAGGVWGGGGVSRTR